MLQKYFLTIEGSRAGESFFRALKVCKRPRAIGRYEESLRGISKASGHVDDCLRGFSKALGKIDDCLRGVPKALGKIDDCLRGVPKAWRVGED